MGLTLTHWQPAAHVQSAIGGIGFLRWTGAIGAIESEEPQEEQVPCWTVAVGIWRTIAALQTMEQRLCKTFVARLRKQLKLSLFFARRIDFRRQKRLPFGDPASDSKRGSSRSDTSKKSN